MPCNTAHHHVGAIRAAVSIPVLNIVDLSIASAAGGLAPGATLGILASPAVQKVGAFNAALDRTGLSAVWPANAERMLHATRTIKIHRPTDES